MKVTDRGRAIISSDSLFMLMLSNYAIVDFINITNSPGIYDIKRDVKIMECNNFIYQVTTNIYKSSIISTVVKRDNGKLTLFERLFGIVNKNHKVLCKKAYLYHAYSDKKVKFIKEIKDHPFPSKYYDLQ